MVINTQELAINVLSVNYHLSDGVLSVLSVNYHPSIEVISVPTQIAKLRKKSAN